MLKTKIIKNKVLILSGVGLCLLLAALFWARNSTFAVDPIYVDSGAEKTYTNISKESSRAVSTTTSQTVLRSKNYSAVTSVDEEHKTAAGHPEQEVLNTQLKK